MKTTIEIRDDLLSAVKERARRHGIPVRALLERALERELMDGPVEPKPFHIKVFDQARPRPEFFAQSWDRQRDLIYADRHARAVGFDSSGMPWPMVAESQADDDCG